MSPSGWSLLIAVVELGLGLAFVFFGVSTLNTRLQGVGPGLYFLVYGLPLLAGGGLLVWEAVRRLRVQGEAFGASPPAPCDQPSCRD